MAELSFKSAGVGTQEIDLTGPSQATPQGIPAGVIGTAERGPAFVPVTVATMQDFITKFGESDGRRPGPIAMSEWLRNASAGTYVRILGTGDGKKRTTTGNNSGKVTNSGFVVGGEQVQANGIVDANPKAGTADPGTAGTLGRTYFLGCAMSESLGSTLLSAAGRLHPSSVGALPVLRGVIMTPSGVLPALSASFSLNAAYTVPGNNPSTSVTEEFSGSRDGGWPIGAVDKSANGRDSFVMILNGHNKNSEFPNVVTASFDPGAPNYFANVFNTDPQKIEKAGHVLYAHWDVHPQIATVTSSQVTSINSSMEPAAFLVSGSSARNVGSTTTPNYENFEDRYKTANSPWVISQKFGGLEKNLFRIHALDDGAAGNTKFKISIENIAKSNATGDNYGTFDLLVRRFDDNDRNKVSLERYPKLNLDPSSERYIARVVGDRHIYYDFDKGEGSQKLVINGLYSNRSSYIRVEVDTAVGRGTIEKVALPLGFRGHNHLVTSGSVHMANPSLTAMAADVVQRMQQPPVPFRDNIAVGTSTKLRTDSALYWGVQFEVKDSATEPNKNNKLDSSIASFTKYFPDFHTTWLSPWIGANNGTDDANGSILDADRFNNNKFTLERVQIVTGSTSDIPDVKNWHLARYRRADSLDTTLADSRFLNVDKDFGVSSAKKYLKFSFFMQGGYDGVNIFDVNKSRMLNKAIKNEIDDAGSQGGTDGPTIKAYRKAVDVMERRTDVDIQLLAIPGARHETITDYAVDAVTDRFDALYIMDIEERDNLDTVITGSGAISHVGNTVGAFTNRALDTSMAAAYYPDVIITDPTTKANVLVPPSVAVLGAYALNDAKAHPWFAPAGFARGALEKVVETSVKLNQENLDDLAEADVNPITSFPHTPGVVVFGQKTLQQAQSALDRINVRRLLIDLRRKVRVASRQVIFEPNRAETLAKFENIVKPILRAVQQQQGLTRYAVKIDASTTTQVDIENNTLRGRIFIQPTNSVEGVALSFNITNAGVDI
jgi:hypothetical protein